MMNAPVIPLDYLWYADHGITLTGQTVRHWVPQKGARAFMEQVEESARPKLVLSGTQPVIRFDGKSFLHFRAFGAEKGPHTFVFVARAKEGLFLDSQHGGPTVQAPKTPWRVYEVIQDSEVSINGETTLGANYYGNADFLKGEIAAFGYKQGILQRGQREYLHKLLEQRLGEAEKAFWIFRIPKPKWWKL